MIEVIEKHWPMSEGDGKATRKKKPRLLAITTDCCTGCAGSPACIEYCPIEACMFWVPDDDHSPFGRIEVDPYLCIGCQKCISKGRDAVAVLHRRLLDYAGQRRADFFYLARSVSEFDEQ